MTVKELKERLEQVAEETEIVIAFDSFRSHKGMEQESHAATGVEESNGKIVLRG